jgi:hypothetical protein
MKVERETREVEPEPACIALHSGGTTNLWCAIRAQCMQVSLSAEVVFFTLSPR